MAIRGGGLGVWRRLEATAASLAFGAIVAGGCASRSGPSAATANAAAMGGCSQQTPTPCEAACFSGSGPACAIFGAALEGTADAPVRLPQDRPRGRLALHRGCDQLGDLASCRVLTSYDDEVLAPGEACGKYESLCGRGEERSCSHFASCLLYDDHFRRDPQRGMELYRRGCERNERVACRALGYRTLYGELVAKDEAKAFELFTRACNLDDPLACSVAGSLLELGRGVARDLQRAKALYRSSCARGVRPMPCESLRRLGERPPSTTVVSGGAAESNHVSDKFGWEWRIPADWEFVPPETLGWQDNPLQETVSARPRAGGLDSLTIAATNVIEVVPGKSPEKDPDSLNRLEQFGSDWIRAAGAMKTGSSRTDVFGSKAVRVEGVIASPKKRFLTLTYFYRDRRRFEMRCLHETPQWGLPCAEAFGALVVHEQAPAVDVADQPRVLHLRDARFHLAFDPPDDTWLAIGPRWGLQGRQAVWIWNKAGRQIDVSALDFSVATVTVPHEQIVSRFAEGLRANGASVKVGSSELLGRPCTHLEVTPPTGGLQDLFIQWQGEVLYTVLVTVPARDPDLLVRARAGLRVDETLR